MTINRSTAVFFDASCLFAAVASPQGGSGILLKLCAGRWLRGITSSVAFQEAERNLRKKLTSRAVDQLAAIYRSEVLFVAPVPSFKRPAAWMAIVNAKDHHVVAAAFSSASGFLLTMDRTLIEETNSTDLPLRAMTPGEFIEEFVPTHQNLSEILVANLPLSSRD